MIDLRDLVQLQLMQALAWTLLHFVWQGAVLGLAAFLVLRVARPERASTRYTIGVVTLALMLASTMATFNLLARQPIVGETLTFEAVSPASSPAPRGSGVTGWVIADLSASPSARTLLSDAPEPAGPLTPQPLGATALLLIVLGWSAGVLALSVRLIGGWMLTRRLARRAVDSVSPSLESAARRIAERLQLKRGVGIFESGAVSVPTLVGWVKPVVLLPASALSGLSAEQLEAILAHELAHVRRHDYLINLLQSVVETLMFYHPAVWWVSAQIRAEREHCCDDLAVEVCGDRLVYVSALAELTALAGRRGFALAATDGSLVGRVRRILGRQRPANEPAPAWTLLALLALLVGSVGTFGAAARDGGASPAGQSTSASVERTPAAQEPAVATTPVVARADDAPAQQQAEDMLRAEADRLRAEADRLRREADRIRADEARLRAERGSWSFHWFDGLAPVPPVPPVPPLPPEPPEPPVPPMPPMPHMPAMSPVPPLPPMPPVPPMPPMPPMPPEPPTPPAPPDIQASGSGNMTWSNDSEKVQVRWTGAFRLSDDERDIAWVEEGATVTISDGVVFASRVDLRGQSGGRIERTFSKNAFVREYEPEGRQFLADMVAKIVRRSGLFAKERVARFLKQGGTDAVLAQIDRLDDSSYVRRVYYTELLNQAEMSDALLTRVLQRVGTEIKSDYDKRTLLTSIAKLPNATDAHRVSIAGAARHINSDYDQRQTLTAVLEFATSVTTVAGAVLDALRDVRSNHDRAMVLTDLARRGGVTTATTPVFMELVRDMGSSYDQRRVLTALATTPGLPEATAVEAVKAAGAISSSHDQRETLSAYLAASASTPKVAASALQSTSTISSSHDRSTVLLDLVERGGLTDTTADSFFTSVGGMSSSFDKSRVLRGVAARPAVTDKVMEGLLRAAAGVSSNHDRANVLVDVASRHRLSEAARQLYIDAAESIGSSHDGNRALAALIRSQKSR